MFVINSTVCDAQVHISLSNSNAVPNDIKWKPRETPKERDERNARPRNGAIVLPQTESVSLVGLLEGLETAGFMITDSFAQTRVHETLVNKKDPRREILYSLVVFNFYRGGGLARSLSTHRSVDNRESARVALQEMCEDAMWRLTTFCNPFFRNGVEVPGHSSLSFNLVARTPLFLPDGKPVAVWQRDEERNKVGEAAIPITPEYNLRFFGEKIQLENNEVR